MIVILCRENEKIDFEAQEFKEIIVGLIGVG